MQSMNATQHTASPTDYCLVTTNVPDQATAERIAQHIVQEKLAACVNILAPCHSVYEWQGKLEMTQEIPMLMKTTRAHYKALEDRLRSLHPYELPEIVCVSINDGLQEYLAWVSTHTSPQAPHQLT